MTKALESSLQRLYQARHTCCQLIPVCPADYNRRFGTDLKAITRHAEIYKATTPEPGDTGHTDKANSDNADNPL